MAKKGLPKAAEPYKFKKGQSGNPSGGRAHDPALRMIRHLTKAELVEIGNLVIKNNMEELKKIGKDPNASVIKTMLAAVAVKIITKGDMHALDVLLNRLVGKVKDEVEHTGTLHAPQVVVTLPSNGREVREPDGSSKG